MIVAIKKMWHAVLCYFGEHSYYVIRHYDRVNRKVGCHHCKRTWAMNDKHQAFLPWDKEFEDFYNDPMWEEIRRRTT